MKCPRCEVDMMEFNLKGVEIDRCNQCGGIYLDKGELEQVLHQEIGHVIDLKPISEAETPEFASPARCFSCSKDMIELQGAADVHFDWCDSCEAIFFDRGELSIMQAFEAD